MLISSHLSARRTGQTSVFVTRWGAFRERPTRIMTTPLSPSVGAAKISNTGSCGSTQSRNISFRRSANSAHCGMGEISAATGGLLFDSLIPNSKAPPCAFAKATASSSIWVFARSPIELWSDIQGSGEPFPFAGKVSLNSICSPSGTCESIKYSMSEMSISSLGLESTGINGLLLQSASIWKRVSFRAGDEQSRWYSGDEGI